MFEIGTGDEGNMTKIGEGNPVPEEPTVDAYKKQLDASSTKFLSALEEYNQSQSPGRQEHLRDVMNQQMAVIKSSISELNKQGMHKDAMKVSKDYNDYMDEETSSNYISLRNDLETLRDLNRQ